METIPTPRTDKAWENIPFFDPSLPAHARQLERELHMAKQALERIVKEKGRPM